MFHKVFSLVVFSAAAIYLAIQEQEQGALAAGVFLRLVIISILSPQGIEEKKING